MKAVILAGGIGVRLRPFTFSIPKPLLPIGEKPILEIIVNKLKKQGFREIIMAIGYKSKMIQAYFGDGSEFGINITYLIEKKLSGTAGPLAQLRKKTRFTRNESLLLMNGDILTSLNFKKMVEYHKNNGLAITVGVKNIKEKNAYGVIEIKNKKINKIIEKPFFAQSVSAGIYIISSHVLKEIPQNKFFTMPNLINKLTSENFPVGAYDIKEFWVGMENLKYFEDIHNNAAIRNEILKG